MTAETLKPERETRVDETAPAAASAVSSESGTSTEEGAPEGKRTNRARLVVGFAVVALFLLFLGFGSVTAFKEPLPGGVRESQPMRVVRVWELLHDNLPEVEHQGLLRLVLDAALVVLIVSIAACVWLALAASPDVAPPSETSDGGA